MTSSGWMGASGRTWRLATIAGIGVGAVYALSPLTVLFTVAMWALCRYAADGLEEDERRWVTALLVCAIALRVIAVAVLFATTNHEHVPFGTFFGDEEYYLRRSIWLRNVALRVPIHSADLIYAFDDSGWTSHLYVLGFLQVLVGPSPYGVHLFGIGLFLLSSVMLFRMVRPAFGVAPAVTGLTLLLFLPSLFAWSISALKEPLYFLLTVCAISCSLRMVRHRRWTVRFLALIGVVALVAALQTIREQGGLLAGGGIVAGLVIVWLVSRPRVLVAVLVAFPIVTGAILSQPKNQIRAYGFVQQAARQHWGHVQTQGWVYTLLDNRFYGDISTIRDMEFAETSRFLVRAVERYITVPLPWEARSAAALAYLPELIVWYLMIALVPFGIVFSFRRDAVLTGILVGVMAVAAIAIALFSGNVGTLVRHRGLAVPYLVWLSMVGLCEGLASATARRGSRALEEAEPIWQ